MKQKRQIGVLFILVVAAAIVWAWNFRDKRVVTADAGPNLQEDPIIQVPNPHIRMEQIERARRAEYKGSGRNPFSPAQALPPRSEEHTSELQSQSNLVCRLLLEKKKKDEIHRHSVKQVP